MTNLRQTKDTVLVGTGKEATSTSIGKLHLSADNKTIKVAKTMYIPGFRRNILSVPRLIQKGFCISMNKQGATAKKGSITLCFNIEPSTGFYILDASCLQNDEVHNSEGTNMKKLQQKGGKRMTLSTRQAHEQYGHMHEAALRKTFAYGGVHLTGTIKDCASCAVAKAKQRATNKVSENVATKPAEQFFADTSRPFPDSPAGSKYWVKFVCQATGMSFDYFCKSKAQLADCANMLFTKLSASGHNIKYLRCDNAGENKKKLEDICNSHGVTIEYVSPNMLQHNGVVEQQFATNTSAIRAMLHASGLAKNDCNRLWSEAANTQAYLRNKAVTGNRDKPSYTLFYGTDDAKRRLVEFGRMAVVAKREKIKSKMKNRGRKAYMVGYATDHETDAYRLYVPDTRRVIISRDITWCEWQPDQKQGPTIIEINDTDDASKDIIDIAPRIDYEARRNRGEQQQEHEQQAHQSSIANPNSNRMGTRRTPNCNISATANNQRQSRELHRLDTFFNPQSEQTQCTVPNRDSTSIPDFESSNELHLITHHVKTETSNKITETTEQSYAVTIASDPGEPITLKEALAGPERKEWRKAAINEVMNFVKRGSWRKIHRTQVSKLGCQPIPLKWVFKKKNEHDGSIRYKARIVVKGYMQIPGVNFTETFSPVSTNTSIRMTICLALYLDNWLLEMFDVEAAFLNAEAEETIYLEWPDGIVDLDFCTAKEKQEKCIALVRNMYGTVNSPLLWMQTIGTYLKDIGLVQSKTDPCIFFKHDNKDKLQLILCLYVDDTLVAGTQKTIDWLYNKVEERFTIERLGQLRKHLGIWYDWKEDNKGEQYLVASMPNMVKDIKQAFKATTGRLAAISNTPGTPGKVLSKNNQSPLHQAEY